MTLRVLIGTMTFGVFAASTMAVACGDCGDSGHRNSDAGVVTPPSYESSEPLVLVPPTLDVALEGLRRDAPITARFDSTEGPIHCVLDAAASPHAVAMFVGLARGRATWRDSSSMKVTNVKRPYYDGLTVFRAVDNLYVQSGCPIGDGTGHPGYRLEIESHADDDVRLARAGALFLASYQRAPNREDPSPPPPGHVIGSQFVIALGDMRHLASPVTVIGSCRDLDVVSRIAKVVASKEHIVSIQQVTIAND